MYTIYCTPCNGLRCKDTKLYPAQDGELSGTAILLIVHCTTIIVKQCQCQTINYYQLFIQLIIQPFPTVYYSKNQYPWNKIHNIQRVGSPAGIPLGLWPCGILQGNQLVEYCVFYSTGIGSCYMTLYHCILDRE